MNPYRVGLFIERGVPIPHNLGRKYQELADMPIGAIMHLPSSGQQLNYETAYKTVQKYQRSSGRKFSCRTIRSGAEPYIEVARRFDPDYPPVAKRPLPADRFLPYHTLTALEVGESILIERETNIGVSWEPHYKLTYQEFRRRPEEFQFRFMDYGMRIWRVR